MVRQPARTMKSQRSHNWDFVILAFLTAAAILVAAFTCSTLLLPAGKENHDFFQGLKALGVFSFFLLCVIGVWVAFADRDQDNLYDRHGKHPA